MRKFIGLLLIGGLCVSGAAVAGETAKAQDPSQKIVCKSERFVGSNMSSRICKTKLEWDQSKTQSKEILDRSNGEMRMPKPKGAG